MAIAYQKVGDVQGFPPIANLGNTSGALASYDKALKIVLALNRSKPDDMGVRHALSGLYFRRAWCLEEANDFRGALNSIRSAVPITEDESLHRKDIRTLDMLAGTYQVMALILTDLGDLDGALMNYKQATAILIKADGATAEQAALLQTHLAGAYCKMSVVYELKGQLDPALDVANQGLQLLERLTRNDPENATLRIFTEEAQMMAASIQTHRGESKQALANLQRAQQSFFALSAADPSNVAVRMDLSYNEVHTGDAFLSEKMPRKALASFTDTLTEFERIRTHLGPHDDTAVGVAQADLGIARVHWMLATTSKMRATAEYRLAQSSYSKSVSILSEIYGRGALAAQDQVALRQAMAGSAACDRVITPHDGQTTTRPAEISRKHP